MDQRARAVIDYDAPAVYARLGHEPDGVVAASLGVHVSAVWSARAFRGIPPHAQQSAIAHADEIAAVLITGPQSGRALAAALAVEAKVVSTSLRLLEAEGLVERSHPGPHPGVANRWWLAGERPTPVPEQAPAARGRPRSVAWRSTIETDADELRRIDAHRGQRSRTEYLRSRIEP